MLSRRIGLLAAAILLYALQPAAAQFQSSPEQFPPGQSPFGGAPSQAPFGAPPQPQQQEMPPCIKDFIALRDDAEKKANAIRAAQKRKAPLPEACRLLTAFVETQGKMLKYAKEKTTSCGIPQQIIDQISKGQAGIVETRTRVCQMAAQPPRPTGPTLSDVLGGSSVPDAANIKTGRGTYDTLSGTPLGK